MRDSSEVMEMATILIVDDDPVVQRMLAYVLEGEGHEICTAQNGLEALNRLEETAVDLVVSDLKMPVMDGITLLERLRDDDRHRQLPVVILTVKLKAGRDVPADIIGSTDFLSKPVSSEELLDVISRRLAPGAGKSGTETHHGDRLLP